MTIAKYFWDLNEAELAKTRRVLRTPNHPRFAQRMTTLLSRCDQPTELFSVLPKKNFIEAWPIIRSYWIRRERTSHHRDWWETLYEQMVETNATKTTGRSSAIFQKLGDAIKEKRVVLGLNQKQLAQRTQLSQSVVSQIEDGKKNITLFTLIRLCKVLGIKSLTID